jgi:hypothetical protein
MRLSGDNFRTCGFGLGGTKSLKACLAPSENAAGGREWRGHKHIGTVRGSHLAVAGSESKDSCRKPLLERFCAGKNAVPQSGTTG